MSCFNGNFPDQTCAPPRIEHAQRGPCACSRDTASLMSLRTAARRDHSLWKTSESVVYQLSGTQFRDRNADSMQSLLGEVEACLFFDLLALGEFSLSRVRMLVYGFVFFILFSKKFSTYLLQLLQSVTLNNNALNFYIPFQNISIQSCRKYNK